MSEVVPFVVSLTTEASADLLAAVAWYEGQRPGLSQDFLAALEAVLARLAQLPRSFPLVVGLPSTHQAPLARFPYRVVFRIYERRVVVGACLHQRRAPEVLHERFRQDN
jgi:toxin ParE1/3/4